MHRNRFYLFLNLLVLSALSGCAASATVSRYPTANYSPTQADQVGVFTNYPPVPYEVIGEIEGEAVPGATWGQLSEEMKKKAATIGGDAVVILVKDTPYVGTSTQPGTIQGTSYSSPSTATPVAWQQSTHNYSYSPPSSTPMYGKYARGFVIRYLR